MFKAASRFLCLLALLLLLAGNARAFRFFYASECEQTRFGEFGYLCWEDTVTGPVQCNSQMRLNDCVFADTLYISCHPPYMPCDTPDAVFLVPPVFNAPHLVIPHQLTNLRNPAIAQGNVFDEPYKSYRVYLRGDSLTICRWWTGTLFDSTDCWSAPIFNGSAFFFDAPLQIQGHLTGQLYVGCSKTILLEDNIIYDDANPENGETPENSNNLLVLASEKEIKVANTWANGRNNSNGLGYNQTNPDSTSIVITAALYALGESFTFEQQNDRDSGYVYTEGDSLVPHTDDRGTVYLYGGLTQWRRGYLHRSNNGSTGYLKRYHYDRRFHTLPNPYPFRFERPYYQTTEAIDFGGVPLGQTVWDTAYVYPAPDFGNVHLGSVTALPPFAALRIPPFEGDSFAVPVSFTPQQVGQFSGELQAVLVPGFAIHIPLHGQGLPGGGMPPFRVVIAPNPFNALTTIHYSIPLAAAVRITLYDVLGRVAKQVNLERVNAGEHSLQINGTDLASGVYFVHLQNGQQTLTQKILLLK